MELGVLLEISRGTFTPENFPHVLHSVKSLCGSFVIGPTKTRVGIVTFDADARLAIPLTRFKSRAQLNSAVDRIKLSASHGPGSLGKGLLVTRAQLFQGVTRAETPKILIVIVSSVSGDEVHPPAVQLREVNTTVVVIGVGDRVDRPQLESVASPRPSEHYVEADITTRESAGQNTGSRILQGGFYSRRIQSIAT